MNDAKAHQPKIVAFTCNWEAYSAIEGAGGRRENYSPGIRAVRLSCLGSISTNDILEALRQGADGVVLLACPETSCHFETGSALAEKTFEETVKLLEAAGIGADRLEFQRASLDGVEQLVRKLQAFEGRLQQFAARASQTRNT